MDSEADIIKPLTDEFQNPEFSRSLNLGSRYVNLFDLHGQQEYDTRRQSFLESMSRISMRRMRASLERIRGRIESLRDRNMLAAFQEWTMSFQALHDNHTLDMPEGFLAAAWSTYKATLQDPRYYFSIHELLLFGRLAKVNLVVTTYTNNEFRYAGATSTGHNLTSIVHVCLGDDRTGRVRGHFERMWKVSEIDESQEAWSVECDMQAERKRLREAEDQVVAKEAEAEKRKEKRESEEMKAEEKHEDRNAHIRVDGAGGDGKRQKSLEEAETWYIR